MIDKKSGNLYNLPLKQCIDLSLYLGSITEFV